MCHIVVMWIYVYLINSLKCLFLHLVKEAELLMASWMLPGPLTVEVSETLDSVGFELTRTERIQIVAHIM